MMQAMRMHRILIACCTLALLAACGRSHVVRESANSRTSSRVPAGEPGDVRVDIRGKEIPVRVVKFPFVRDGKAMDGI